MVFRHTLATSLRKIEKKKNVVSLKKKCVMDLQTRKISFIQEFLNFQNEEIILRFEKLLKKEKNRITSNKLEPMTLEEFNRRIDTSLEDSNNDRITESSELLSEIEKWG